MQEEQQKPLETNTQAVDSQKTMETTDTPQKKQTFSLNVILSILLLVIVAIAGFFYWQNMQLKKMVAENLPQTVTTSTPTPIETPDPTEGWKTYTNIAHSYSISFPQKWETQSIAAGAGDKEAPVDADNLEIYNVDMVTAPYPYGVISIQVFGLTPTYDQKLTKSVTELNGIKAVKYENNNPNELNSITYLFETPEKKYIEIQFSYTNEDPIIETFNNILSTFRFTESPTPSPLTQ